ncbi:MAG: response regulator [Actinomycetota bacterium]|jgi:putative two-component system response regulator|nr:response regulator [Actinomycetota bacterium]
MHILVADDDPSSQYLLATMFKSRGHLVTTANDGREALELARDNPPDILVTDILMPVMDGYQLAREWKTDDDLSGVPLVFYTANYTDADDERFALSLGADKFLFKPLDPTILLNEIEQILKLSSEGHLKAHMPSDVNDTDVLKEYNARLVSKLEGQLLEVQETRVDLETTVKQLSEMVDGAVTAIAKLVEARDPYTSGHQERVSALAETISRTMTGDESFTQGVRLAGLIHDIGKIYVPAEILSKPRRLTPAEFSLVKVHPQVAYDVLASIAFPWPIADYIVQHHERMDGSGYPNGLKGEDISLGGRILAVADVMEAMSSHRPYKVAAGIDAALDEIEKNSGHFYDSEVAAACVLVFTEQGFKFPDAAASPLIQSQG